MNRTETIAHSIRHLMLDQGKTQTELATVIGCGRNKAGQIYHGHIAPRADEWYAIATWLGCDVMDLARGFELVPMKDAA